MRTGLSGFNKGNYLPVAGDEGVFCIVAKGLLKLKLANKKCHTGCINVTS